jgi:hypothetical protein
MRVLLVPHDVDASHAAALPAAAKTVWSSGRLGPWIRADATWRDAILITAANFSRIRHSRGITHFHHAVTICCVAQYHAAVHIGGASGVAEVEWRMEMKTILLMATALLVTSPAFAQSYDPSVGSGNIARAPSAPPAVYRGAEGAFARVPPGATHRRAPSAAVQAPNYPVYDEYGHYVGADPDPNIRFQLHRDADSIGGF